MKPCLVDVNVWVALTHDGHEHHDRASAWFDGVSKGEAYFCRMTQVAYLRLITNQRIAESSGARHCSLDEAWECYDLFLADPRVGFLAESGDIEGEFRKMSRGRLPATKVLVDGYLAAFANSWGIGLVTCDKGFAARGGVRGLTIIE